MDIVSVTKSLGCEEEPADLAIKIQTMLLPPVSYDCHQHHFLAGEAF
jgi:hypothetical protein